MEWSFESKKTIRGNIKIIAEQEIETVVMEDDGSATEDKLAELKGMFRLLKAIITDIDNEDKTDDN